MSVHELKRPPMADITEWQVNVRRALEQLRHWAQINPLQPALRHKRHGQWFVWRWIDVLRDVERWAQGAQLWSEEGTQWQNGLTVLLEQWLSRGHSLAFPERPGSARRDRREVAPSGLLLSTEGLQRLAADIESRLAPQGTWRRRLCDWAIARPERGLRRLIKNLVRRRLGFHNLHFIWQATRSADAKPERTWLADFKQDSA